MYTHTYVCICMYVCIYIYIYIYIALFMLFVAAVSLRGTPRRPIRCDAVWHRASRL